MLGERYIRTMKTIHVAVKELPEVLQSTLRSIGYHKSDIGIEASETASLFDAGSDGRRGFAVLVDLTTGRSERHMGSWGGANIFNPTNSVDLDTNEYTLPPNGCVILGSEGYKGVFASIVLNSQNVAKLLPVSTDEVSDKDRAILYAYGALKSGTYRQDELRRIKATETEISSLISRGYLKQNKVGIAITTLGKNNRGNGY